MDYVHNATKARRVGKKILNFHSQNSVKPKIYSMPPTIKKDADAHNRNHPKPRPQHPYLIRQLSDTNSECMI